MRRKGVPTPEIRYSIKQMTLSRELQGDERTMFRSVLGLVQYIAHDRPDIQHAAHVVATASSTPTLIDEVASSTYHSPHETIPAVGLVI